MRPCNNLINTPPTLGSKGSEKTTEGRHPLGFLLSGPGAILSGRQSPPGGPDSASRFPRRYTLPFIALLAALALCLLFLLPGGFVQAQDAADSIMYAEKGTGPVATYTAEDPEGTAITWSLSGNDAGDFDINEGVLTFKQSPNYEDPADVGTDNVYDIMVVATDSDNSAAQKAVTVMVTDVDEAGTLTLSTLQPVDGIEVTATLTDIDSVTDGNLTGTVTATDITWKWAKSLNRADAYTDIDGVTLATYTPKPDDVNHYLRATATYTDPQGSDKTEMAMSAYKVLAPRSTNTPPVFKDGDGEDITEAITREVAENSAAGTDVGDPVEASDAEGDVLTYTLGGTDEASFDIDVATGQLRTKAPLDKETKAPYEVQVTATDPSFTTGDDSDMITVNITVTNVDEAPELTGMASVRVPENTAVLTTLTTVGTYMATDDEDGPDVPLTLSGTDAADFNFNEWRAHLQAVYQLRRPSGCGHRQRIQRNGGGHRQRQPNGRDGRNRDR